MTTTRPLSLVPTTSATTLPGLEQVPPGIAYQVQAAHDATVGALEALLAESRQDADANANRASRAAAHAEAYLSELRAARPVVDAARGLVATWDASGIAQQLLVSPDRTGGAALVRAVRAATEEHGL